jgi:hypothetical protein
VMAETELAKSSTAAAAARTNGLNAKNTSPTPPVKES